MYIQFYIFKMFHDFYDFGELLKEKSFLFVLNFEENLVQNKVYLILAFIIFIENSKNYSLATISMSIMTELTSVSKVKINQEHSLR